jgi:glucose-1-phosphate cytidylyltransferase
MKVVLFCGGLGMRLRDYDENLPKPMVTIGYRPIIWHVMKYYAHFGHNDFILCLGHKADVIKRYFLEYDECLSNDFVLSAGGERVELLNSDIHDWRITFADTGPSSPIGERLRRIRPFLDGEDVFLANYTDCLTDMDLEAFLDDFEKRDRIGGLVTVVPAVSQHYVTAANGVVTGLAEARGTPFRVNAGFFAFRSAIFDYIEPGDELVEAPFHRLIRERQLVSYEYDGFWKAMDTFKDKQQFDELLSAGDPPWAVWQRAAISPSAGASPEPLMRRRRRSRIRPGMPAGPGFRAMDRTDETGND